VEVVARSLLGRSVVAVKVCASQVFACVFVSIRAQLANDHREPSEITVF